MRHAFRIPPPHLPGTCLFIGSLLALCYESRCTPYNAYTATCKATARRYGSSGNAGICTHFVPRFLPVGRRRKRVNNACKGSVQIHLWTPPTRDPSGIFVPLSPVSVKACTPLNRGDIQRAGSLSDLDGLPALFFISKKCPAFVGRRGIRKCLSTRSTVPGGIVYPISSTLPPL